MSEEQSNMLQMLKTEPKDKLPDGMQLVSFSRKSTEKNPVPDSDKFRCVVCAAFPGVSVVPENSILAAALTECIANAATNILQRHFIDSKQETIPAKMLEWSEVLAMLETQQSSQRINGEQIAVWYDKSETGKRNKTRYFPEGVTEASNVAELTPEVAVKVKAAVEKGKMLRGKYISLASNNPSISTQQATAMLAYMHEDDLPSTMAKALCKKLQPLTVDKNKAEEL